MKSRFSLLATILSLALLTGFAIAPAEAEGKKSKDIPNAQTLIDACWKDSLEKRSNPGTAVVRSGLLDTVLCLENVITDQFTLYSPNLSLPHDKEPGLTTDDRVKKKLKELRFSAGGLYWWIFMDNPGCVPSCGSMYATFHLSENARILERMIRLMIDQRKEYGF